MAIATDTAYLPWCAVTILSSVLATPDAQLRFHVLHQGDVSPSDGQHLADMIVCRSASVELTLVEPCTLAQFPSNQVAGGGRISWSRLLLADLLPDQGRVIYLDADTLVRKSLRELWYTDLEDSGVGAVRNVTAPIMYPHLRRLGIYPPAEYFNAGVLLVDLNRLRCVVGDLERVMAEYGSDLVWYDQDALNLIFADDWLALDPSWNAQNSFWTWVEWARPVFGEDLLEKAKADPAIRHFEGPTLSKPWHYLCQDPFRRDYRSVLEQTPWLGQPLEERTVMTMTIARLPLSWQLPAYLRAHRAIDRSRRVLHRIKSR